MLCDFCQAPTSEEDVQKGLAVTVLGRHYCARCKDLAIQRSRSKDSRPDFVTPHPRPLDGADDRKKD